MSLLNIYDERGRIVNLKSLHLFGLKLHVPSPSYNVITETVDGGGTIIIEKILNPRDLVAEFFTRSGDYVDSLELRDELFTVLNSGETLFIGESNLNGKRWLVHPGNWSPERLNLRVQRFDVPLFAPSGVAESINIINKTFEDAEFIYRNQGSYEINMRSQEETEITFTGASSNLEIKNITTGDVWSYNGTTLSTDVIKLKGVSSLKNDVSIFKHTNKKLISFEVGNNEFEIVGATGTFELTIRTRYYFL